MTTTIELIKKADHLATETWVNGEGLGGEVSKTFSNLAQRLRALDKPDCVWAKDHDGDFETQCGHVFFFDEGGIKENDCKFCQYCGGAVKEST